MSLEKCIIDLLNIKTDDIENISPVENGDGLSIKIITDSMYNACIYFFLIVK